MDVHEVSAWTSTRAKSRELAKAGSAIFVCARDVTANDADLGVVLILVQDLEGLYKGLVDAWVPYDKSETVPLLLEWGEKR